MFAFSNNGDTLGGNGLRFAKCAAAMNSVLGAPHNAVVPVGGARLIRGRDRISYLICAAMIAAMPGHVAASSPADLIAVPSGQAVTLHEIIDDRETGALRFRFLAPQIAFPDKVPEFDAITADLQYLCNEYAVKTLTDAVDSDDTIVISLAAEPVEFGVAAPDVMQFFDAFHVENGTCIWEMF